MLHKCCLLMFPLVFFLGIMCLTVTIANSKSLQIVPCEFTCFPDSVYCDEHCVTRNVVIQISHSGLFKNIFTHIPSSCPCDEQNLEYYSLHKEVTLFDLCYFDAYENRYYIDDVDKAIRSLLIAALVSCYMLFLMSTAIGICLMKDAANHSEIMEDIDIELTEMQE